MRKQQLQPQMSHVVGWGRTQDSVPENYHNVHEMNLIKLIVRKTTKAQVVGPASESEIRDPPPPSSEIYKCEDGDMSNMLCACV